MQQDAPAGSAVAPRRPLVFGRYDYAAFLAYFAYAAGSVVAPVSLVALARDLGFRLEEGGMTAGGALHLGRTGAIVAAMLLCGFIAAKWGKRSILSLSILLMGFGMGIVACAPSYTILFLALVVAGLGEGVIEGLATPFVQDLHPDDQGRYVNFSHAFWSIGVVVTVLAAGILISSGVSWRLVTGGVAIGALIPAGLLLLPAAPGKSYAEHHEVLEGHTVWARAKAILRVPRFWLFFAAMFVAGGGEFCLTFWSASYIQLNFSSSAWIGGVGTACFAAGMAIGRTGSGYWIHQHQLKGLVVASAIFGTLVTLVLPMTGNLTLFLILLFFTGLASAPYWPSIQSYCADEMPELDTTLLMILLACAGIPGCGIATWLMGYIGDRYGLNHAFYLVPACYLILGVLIGYDGYLRKRR